MVAVLNPGDKLGIAAPTKPNLVLGIESGVKAWTSQRFRPDTNYIHSFDLGNVVVSGLVTYANSGTGSGKTLVTGDTLHPAGWGSLNKGTTTSGRTDAMHSSSAAALRFVSTSGTWVYECLMMLPFLSDSTDTFAAIWGFTDTINAEDGDGAYFMLSSQTNVNLLCKTSNANTRTSVDSGFAISASTWYKLKIVVTNNTQVDFYAAAEGASYTLVGTITTNIPTASGRETGWGMKILGTAGTTAGRAVQYYWQYVYNEPTPAAANPPISRVFPGALNRGDGVGIPNGPEGYKLGVNESGVLAWIPRQRLTPTQLMDWFVMDRAVSREFINDSSGTGAGVLTTTPEAGYPFTSNIATGSTATGRGARSMMSGSVSPTIVLGSSSGTFVAEALFKVVNLSDGTNNNTFRFGYWDNHAGAPSNGAYIELNSNANVQAQCVTIAGSTSTATSSGVTIAADTWYWCRIVITNNSQVQFYLALQGSSLALVATNTTNIPSGTGQPITIGLSFIKSLGTTGHSCKWNYLMGYHLK